MGPGPKAGVGVDFVLLILFLWMSCMEFLLDLCGEYLVTLDVQQNSVPLQTVETKEGATAVACGT